MANTDVVSAVFRELGAIDVVSSTCADVLSMVNFRKSIDADCGFIPKS